MNIQKLLNIQRDLNAPKTQFNKCLKYYYRNCEDILGAVKPLCVRENAVLTLTDSIENIGGKNYIKATATLTDTEDGKVITLAEAYAREPETKPGVDASQITGAASSYARKYALNALFAIDDTKDADSDETPQKAENKPVAAKKGNGGQVDGKNEEKPLTLKEAMQERIEIKGTEYRLGALNAEQLDWVISKANGRTKEAAELIKREKYKSALEDEQEAIPFK